MVAALESDAAVAAEGGESDIQVTVSGTIELIMP
jgi:predicted secreted protein